MMVGRPVLFRLEKPAVEIGEPVVQIQGLGGGPAARASTSRSTPARSWAWPASRATGSASWPRR